MWHAVQNLTLLTGSFRYVTTTSGGKGRPEFVTSASRWILTWSTKDGKGAGMETSSVSEATPSSVCPKWLTDPFIFPTLSLANSGAFFFCHYMILPTTWILSWKKYQRLSNRIWPSFSVMLAVSLLELRYSRSPFFRFSYMPYCTKKQKSFIHV